MKYSSASYVPYVLIFVLTFSASTYGANPSGWQAFSQATMQAGTKMYQSAAAAVKESPKKVCGVVVGLGVTCYALYRSGIPQLLWNANTILGKARLLDTLIIEQGGQAQSLANCESLVACIRDEKLKKIEQATSDLKSKMTKIEEDNQTIADTLVEHDNSIKDIPDADSYDILAGNVQNLGRQVGQMREFVGSVLFTNGVFGPTPLTSANGDRSKAVLLRANSRKAIPSNGRMRVSATFHSTLPRNCKITEDIHGNSVIVTTSTKARVQKKRRDSQTLDKDQAAIVTAALSATQKMSQEKLDSLHGSSNGIAATATTSTAATALAASPSAAVTSNGIHDHKS